jgi:hypothetical protein
MEPIAKALIARLWGFAVATILALAARSLYTAGSYSSPPGVQPEYLLGEIMNRHSLEIQIYNREWSLIWQFETACNGGREPW